MARDTLVQRIALDGGKDIQAQLEAIGKSGENAFRKLQAAANQLKIPPTFSASLQKLGQQLNTLGTSFQKVGTQIQGVGRTFSTFVTLPIVGAGTAIIKMAGDFEASMIRVQIATQASAQEFDKMRELARQLGTDTVFSAGEAADAMNELAKAGVSTSDILNGAAKATVDLAAATGGG